MVGKGKNYFYGRRVSGGCHHSYPYKDFDRTPDAATQKIIFAEAELAANSAQLFNKSINPIIQGF